MSVTLAAAHEGRTPKADLGAWTRLGAGNVVARAEDMVVFWQEGRLRTWLGNACSIPMANAELLYDPTVQAYAAVAVNNQVPSAAVANALLKTVSDWQAKRVQTKKNPTA